MEKKEYFAVPKNVFSLLLMTAPLALHFKDDL
jgi:hypothetical protein